jgi:hypothetical protein
MTVLAPAGILAGDLILAGLGHALGYLLLGGVVVLLPRHLSILLLGSPSLLPSAGRTGRLRLGSG